MDLNNTKKTGLPLRSFSLAFLLTLATSASAAPGTLSDVPLYTRGSAEPNIMFLLDSSGSMEAMVLPPSGYDSTATYASCSNPIKNTYTYIDQECSGWGKNRVCWDVEKTGNHDYEIDFRVNRTDGSVQFDVDNDDVGWRTWNSTNNCFSDDETFDAWLYAAGNSNDNVYFQSGSDSGNYRENSVSGHLLNWYFSELNDAGTYVAAKFLDGDDNARRSKLDIRRTDIMKTAAADLISELEDVRVGVMEFNDNDDGNSSNSVDGARALVGLTSVTDDTRAGLLDVIDGIGASGNTPLAESFAAVGRYFISGYESQKLSYVDENADTVEVAGSEIFNVVPDWDDANPDVPVPDNTVAGGAIQYYCQKSFMVALTDGEPTGDDYISDHLKDYDYGCSGNPGSCTNQNQGYSVSGGSKFYQMDDVIKALYDIDLRPDLKKPDGEPVKHNITSYIIGFAESDLSDKPLIKNSGVLGGGGGVYSASDAASLKVTFNQIINKVHAVVGSSSSVAFNSTSLEADSALFAAKFDSGDWSGELAALTIDANGNVSSTASWEAGSILDNVSDISTRVMLTYKAGTGGVAFSDAGIDLAGSDTTTEQDLNINTSSGTAVADNRAAERIAYLRGDRSKEGTDTDKFRTRGSRLGDIVNSTPVYVGKPNAAWSNASFPEATSYSAFKTDKAGRTPVVYVGANDGFLHGFNASTTDVNKGKELIAYSPAALVSTADETGLHALTSQNYLHKYYVDGTPTASDVYINGGWKTVLVGGLGGGGKGYYALNVTDPASFGAASVMWEFTDANNNNLGYSFSRPQIGRMSNGEWAAIFGNGYNSTNGDAGLFIVYLDGSDGTDSYVYISTGTGSANDKNGLSTPAIVDSNLDGTIDRIYAGDLKGNMWVFDVDTTGSWDVHKNAGTPEPLFTATGEPITGAPLVARNTAYAGGSEPNLLVTFGTGQYLTDADTAGTAAGGFYAVSDNGTYGLTKSNLEVRTIATKNVEQEDGSTRSLRTVSGSELNWTTKSGWYMQLNAGTSPDGGERVINRPDLLRNVLFFNTLIPTGQVCSAGGYGWLMSVDVRTGLAPVKFAVFDGNGDGLINSADQGLVGQMVSEGIPNKPGFLNGDTQYTPTSAGTIRKRDVNVGGGDREGRLSWEEITPN